MVYLENEYIKIDVLPGIGGRLWGALDKTNNHEFIYRQHVVKPALVGMLGAWLEGGIEWNFPHHHRPNAFMPVNYDLQENPDGSATLWIGELELRDRMKFMLGISVYPGKSYFEVTFRPINATPFANSFLYFANTSVHTNDNYQNKTIPNPEMAKHTTTWAYVRGFWERKRKHIKTCTRQPGAMLSIRPPTSSSPRLTAAAAIWKLPLSIWIAH